VAPKKTNELPEFLASAMDIILPRKEWSYSIHFLTHFSEEVPDPNYSIKELTSHFGANVDITTQVKLPPRPASPRPLSLHNPQFNLTALITPPPITPLANSNLALPVNPNLLSPGISNSLPPVNPNLPPPIIPAKLQDKTAAQRRLSLNIPPPLALTSPPVPGQSILPSMPLSPRQNTPPVAQKNALANFPAPSLPPVLVSNNSKWWRATTRSAQEVNSSSFVSVIESGKIKNVELYQKLTQILPKLGGDINSVSQARWIDNPKLAVLFEIMLDTIKYKRQVLPEFFNTQDWTQGKPEDVAQKKLVLDHLASLQGDSSLPWFQPDLEPIIPMVQGTSENGAQRIAKNGFGTVASLDPGWYGQGIYFTSKLSYAAYYARPPDHPANSDKRPSQPDRPDYPEQRERSKQHEKSGRVPKQSSEEDERVFLISLVIPGNAYPVIDFPAYQGKPCQQGYQSHYVMTLHAYEGLPVKRPFDFNSGVSNELVIFRGAQTLPVCLLHYRHGHYQPIENRLFTTPTDRNLEMEEADRKRIEESEKRKDGENGIDRRHEYVAIRREMCQE